MCTARSYRMAMRWVRPGTRRIYVPGVRLMLQVPWGASVRATRRLESRQKPPYPACTFRHKGIENGFAEQICKFTQGIGLEYIEKECQILSLDIR